MTTSIFKYTWTVLLFISFISSCGQTDKNSKNGNTTTTLHEISVDTISAVFADTSTIAIIDFNQVNQWIFDSTYKAANLNKAEINKIEKLFLASIADHNLKLSGSAKSYFSIDLKKRKYSRQYICALNKVGQKEVYINCFCELLGTDSNWKRSLVIVDDGGNCFFNLKLNLDANSYYDFFVNGLA